MSPTEICVLSSLIGWSGAALIYAAIDAVLWPKEWFDWLLIDVFVSLGFFPVIIIFGLSLAGLHCLIPLTAKGWNCVTGALTGAAGGTALMYGLIFLFTTQHPFPVISDSLVAYQGMLIFGGGAWLRCKYATRAT